MQSAEEYLKQHDLHTFLPRIVAKLVSDRPKDPYHTIIEEASKQRMEQVSEALAGLQAAVRVLSDPNKVYNETDLGIITAAQQGLAAVLQQGNNAEHPQSTAFAGPMMEAGSKNACVTQSANPKSTMQSEETSLHESSRLLREQFRNHGMGKWKWDSAGTASAEAQYRCALADAVAPIREKLRLFQNRGSAPPLRP